MTTSQAHRFNTAASQPHQKDFKAFIDAIQTDDSVTFFKLLDTFGESLFTAHDTDDNPALIMASIHGRTSFVAALLDKGAPVETAHPENKDTALMQAAWHNHLDILRLLLDKGANINAKDVTEFDAEYYAHVNSSDEAKKILTEWPEQLRLKAEKEAESALIKDVSILYNGIDSPLNTGRRLALQTIGKAAP